MTEGAVPVLGAAQWVERDEPQDDPPGARRTTWFRHRFEAEAVLAARLAITARGVYEAHLNGVRVGDLELTPGYTQYEHRLQVQEHEVAGLLRRGSNELLVEVSDGWWRGQVGLFRAADQWGSATGLLARLELERADGSTTALRTGPSWVWADSAHRADLIAGETIDLSAPGPQGPWRPVALGDPGTAELVTSPAPPVRRIEELRARSIEPRGDRWIVDFGQNLNGWIRLRRPGAAGSRITVTYAEALDPTGDVTQANLVPDIPLLPHPLPAGQVDTIVAGPDPDAVVEPRHSTKGFRYVAVDGLDHDLVAEDVTGVVVHTDLVRTGWFRCSDDSLNRLHDAVVWSFRGNACDIPTDCPTRERGGWSGDWQVFLPTAAFLYDVAGFSTKWLHDFVSGQWPNGILPDTAPEPRFEGRDGPVAFMRGSAGWCDAITIVPWEQYLAYGDAAPLELAWPAIVRWLDFAMDAARNGRHPTRSAARPVAAAHEEFLWDTGFHFGEWLEPEPEVEGDFGAFLAADKAKVATAYLRRSTSLASAIAAALGMTTEADRYAAYSEKVRAAWAAEFLDEDGRVTRGTQADCVRALAFELVPPSARPRVADQLVELVHQAGDHLATGFLATPHLLQTLVDAGHPELAVTLLLQRTTPSWLGMLDQGATTMWERWEGYGPDGTPSHSHNHYSKGAVAAFLHCAVAGISPLEPGYRRFAVRPLFDARLDWAEAAIDSIAGPIRSYWERVEGRVVLDVQVPPGTRCEVTPPDGIVRSVGPGPHRFG